MAIGSARTGEVRAGVAARARGIARYLLGPLDEGSAGTPVPLLDLVLRAIAAVYLGAIIVAIVAYKSAFLEVVTVDPIFGVYSVVVCSFILSRFFLSVVYHPSRDHGLEPTIAVVMPAFNEEDAIAASVRALLAVDYPESKLDVVVVNDGSTDDTLARIQAVAAEHRRVRVIDFPENRGKRAAMVAGIKATDAEMVTFVDSDSILRPNSLRRLVQGFAHPEVGAIAGHADVLNVRGSWITRMQAVRYYVAFRVIKASESVFGMVTCASGCFSAYRREAITPILELWENQRFLGRRATFGDDRALTNYVLRSWKVRYESEAVSHTIVPDTFQQFLRQQLRWKRSWTRESSIVARFIWRKHPLGAIAVYLGILLPLVAPVIACRSLIWHPLVDNSSTPIVYLIGIYAMALIYGLYYACRHGRYDTLWVFGVLFIFFYLVFLLWQTYYAIATAANGSWGTRPSSRPAEAPS
jgi:hyaluronan synthase